MSARNGLSHLHQDRPDRVGRDRLEILTAVIGGPSFDPIYRPDIVKISRGHRVYRWECVVDGCERGRGGGSDLCGRHQQEWVKARSDGTSRARYLAAATPLASTGWERDDPCRICPMRAALRSSGLGLCRRHHHAWRTARRAGPDSMDLERWIARQAPFESYGRCQVRVCAELAMSPLGLCSLHAGRYRRDGQPGAGVLPPRWWHTHEGPGRPVPVAYADEAAFRAWCATTSPTPRPGQINLRGLRPLLRAEIQYALFAHARQDRPERWDPSWLQTLANLARDRDAGSLIDLDLVHFPRFHAAIAKSMLHHLRLIYFTPQQTREAGFLETDHFGVRFPRRASHVDLTAISQRWLRELLWDYLAALLRSPQCPRTKLPVDGLRRAVTELGAFLELETPGGGHDPTVLRVEHAHQFTADQRHREQHGLASLVMKKVDGTPSIVTRATRCAVTNGVRKLLRDALDNGDAERLGLDREFIVAMPTAGYVAGRTARRPFPDEVARALADEANLALLADSDPEDLGIRDVWETIVVTGRRVNEVLRVRWDCLGRYGGLAMFWHDQTKVGNYDAAIRIPERLHQILAERQRKTLDRFLAQHGRTPTGTERATLALFPSTVRNPDGAASLTYHWFWCGFRAWVDSLDLGHYVAHQARHTLATNLLRAGASLTHIRRYLGQASDRMAEHYVHLSHSDLENVLQQVWVAGPGAINPGELLTSDVTAISPAQAQALAIDLSRRSTPAEGGFCTFQPVVDGGACPWNLNCHTCDKFVLSGADLLYWRRKREQWRQLAEGAPDDATADYLHAYFEPTARAIDGLEKALAGLGLLDQALALDLRKPQDYFHRIWSTAFRAADLADPEQEQGENGQECRTQDQETRA
ncbi:MAG: tyrosine-type recombinase/integrase [Pseudonocardiaceae bacterium]